MVRNTKPKTRSKSDIKQRQMVYEVARRVRRLTCNDRGVYANTDEADHVFKDILGTKDFVRRLGYARRFEQFERIVIQAGFRTLWDLLVDPTYYQVLQVLVEIQDRRTDLRKRLKKIDRKLDGQILHDAKSNYADKARKYQKELKYISKQYSRAVEAIQDKLDIHVASDNYKERFKLLKSFVNHDAGRFGDDDAWDLDGIFDDSGSGSRFRDSDWDFPKSGRSRRADPLDEFDSPYPSGNRYRGFDDDSDIDYDENDSDVDDDDSDDDDRIDMLAEKIDRLTDAISASMSLGGNRPDITVNQQPIVAAATEASKRVAPMPTMQPETYGDYSQDISKQLMMQLDSMEERLGGILEYISEKNKTGNNDLPDDDGPMVTEAQIDEMMRGKSYQEAVQTHPTEQRERPGYDPVAMQKSIDESIADDIAQGKPVWGAEAVVRSPAIKTDFQKKLKADLDASPSLVDTARPLTGVVLDKDTPAT